MWVFLVTTYCLRCFANEVIHCISFEETRDVPVPQILHMHILWWILFSEEVFLENCIYIVMERIDSWIQKNFIIPLCSDRFCYSLMERHLISCGFYKVVLDSDSHLILLYYDIDFVPKRAIIVLLEYICASLLNKRSVVSLW